MSVFSLSRTSVSALPTVKSPVTTSPVGSDVPTKMAAKGATKAATKGANSTTFRRRDDGRLTRLMLIVFCSFLVCFLPLTIVNVAESSVSLPLHAFFMGILSLFTDDANIFFIFFLSYLI